MSFVINNLIDRLRGAQRKVSQFFINKRIKRKRKKIDKFLKGIPIKKQIKNQKIDEFFSKRFIIQTDEEKAEESLAIKYIIQLGNLEDRILAINEMNLKDSEVKAFSKTVDRLIKQKNRIKVID